MNLKQVLNIALCMYGKKISILRLRLLKISLAYLWIVLWIMYLIYFFFLQQAVNLSGKKLLGIPIIVQLTQAEKNRSAVSTMNIQRGNVGPMKLYVGSLHYNVTEEMLKGIFEPFGKVSTGLIFVLLSQIIAYYMKWTWNLNFYYKEYWTLIICLINYLLIYG